MHDMNNRSKQYSICNVRLIFWWNKARRTKSDSKVPGPVDALLIMEEVIGNSRRDLYRHSKQQGRIMRAVGKEN